MDEALSFEEISSWYPTVLVDTSSLITCLDNGIGSRLKRRDYGKKYLSTMLEIASAEFFKDFLEKRGDFYVTKGVLGEYSTSLKRYKKKIREVGNLSGDRLNYERASSKCRKIKNKLTNSLEDRGLVLFLTPEEMRWHDLLSEKYRTISKDLGLSEVNNDFLFSGIAVSRRDPSCLVSNDIAILRLFNHVYKKERLNSDHVNFFVRRNFDGFFPSQKI